MLKKIQLCIDHRNSTQSLIGEVWGCYRGAVEDACLLGWRRVKWLIATKFRTRVVLPSSSLF